MKVTLTANSPITVNGIDLVLEKGTEVELPCHTKEEALEVCAIAKLKTDFSYTKDGVKYVEGAGGKFIALPSAKELKADAKKATPKAVTPKK